MQILIAVAFEKVSEALKFFENLMTTDVLEMNDGVVIQISGEGDHDMDEFHDLMTEVVAQDMIEKTEQFLGEQDNGSEDDTERTS